MSDEVYINPNLDNGREYRVGAELYPWDYNNSYDINNVVNDVKVFIDQLYTHSINAQAVLCDVSRIYGSMSDFKRDVSVNREIGMGYYTYTLEVPMKNINCFKTLALKRANPRIYSVDESCRMTELFERRIMMFIDGRLFPGLKFYAEANRFILAIEVNSGQITLDTMVQWIENATTWSILFLPFSTVKSKRGLRSELISGNTIDISKLDNITNSMFVNRNLWLVSISQWTNSRSYTTSTVATMTTTADGRTVLTTSSAFISQFTAANVAIYVTALPNAKGGILLNTARAFQIDLDTNPIPPQNIICWETDAKGSTVKYIHNAKIIMHYPNVYEIEDVPATSNIYVTWCYSASDTTRFINPLSKYMLYNSNYATDIINNNLPAAVKNYIPYESQYLESYYLDYVPKATRRNEFSFKFDTLSDIITDDTSRLEKLYTELVSDTAYKWHSNPRYTIDMATWGDYTSRIRRNTFSELKYTSQVNFGIECVYFTFDHEDDRSYPIAVWIDGLRCMKTWQFTEAFKSYVYLPRALIRSDSIIDFEIMKTRSDKPTVVDTKLSSKDMSTMIPDEFIDVSPQNLMFAMRTETSDFEDDGGVQYIYKVAPNYEMYWLLIGHTEYHDGVPVTYNPLEFKVPHNSPDTTVITTDEDTIILDENGNAITATNGNIWDGGYDAYFAEFGDDLSLISAPNEQFPEYTDMIKVRDLGYYGDARRRFYEYLPNGEDDAPIFITPITNYFADKYVRITNIDVHKTWTYVISSSDKIVKIREFALEPDVSKFRIFLNGRLLDPFHDYVMDASIVNGFYLGSIVTFSILTTVTDDSDLLIEYVPYRYNLKYRDPHVTDKEVQLRESAITRPFSLVYYDVYLDGVRLYARDITIVSPSKIYLNYLVGTQTLSFYERAHDTDIYDNDKYMRKSIVDAIAEEDKSFKSYLFNVSPSIISSAGSGGGCDSACVSSCSAHCGSACDNACSKSCTGSCSGSCENEASKNNISASMNALLGFSAIACAGCVSACAEACTGCSGTNSAESLCSDCTSTCSGCTNSCTGECSGCSGTCTGQCTGCTNCTGICTGGCDGTCTTDCSGSCVGECSGCSGTCEDNCMDDCSGTATSTSGCTDCTTSCKTNCTDGCSGDCFGGCIGTCSTTCVGECTNSCIDTCVSTCSNGCTGCTGTCSGNCAEACTGCTGSCSNGCTGCSGTCSGTCVSTSSSSSSTCSGCDGVCTITCTSSCVGASTTNTGDSSGETGGGSGSCDGCDMSCSSTSASATVSCTGCDTGCSSTCTGDCSGTATSAACSGCGTTCMATCTGCSSTCSGSSTGLAEVTESCSSCDTTCKTACTLACSVGCTSTCTGTCVGCSSTCDGECTSGCSGTCTSTCTGTCTGTCKSSASTTGTSTICSGCYATCTSTASSASSGTSCAASCTSGCSSTAASSSGTSCSSCSAGCSGTCMSSSGSTATTSSSTT